MRNGMIIWNLVITLLTGYLVITHFTQSGEKNRTVSGSNTATSSARNDFRIAYFEMDSVEAHYSMVKDVKAEIDTKETEYNRNIGQLDQTYKNKYNELSAKANMTPEEAESAQNILKDLGEKLKGQRQLYDQDYQDFVTRKNMLVKKNIEEYLKDYNKTKNFSYIITYEPGLYYYRDTSYNITSELINGLNESYKLNKGK